MSQCVPPWIHPLWDSLCFLDLSECFLSHVREVLGYNIFKYFYRFFLFLFSFWDPYNMNVGALNIVPEVSETVLIFFSFFFSLFCSVAVISTTLSSSSRIHSSASVILLLIPFRVFHFSYCIFHLCLFFKSSSSLLNISCIFLICASTHFPRF